MHDLKEVIQNLRNIKTYLSSQAIIASVEHNDIAREGLIESQADVEKAIELLKSQQAEIDRMTLDGKTCANCSRSKIRMARGTGCYYQRCKKHNMWVRSGFYCSDWQKEGR